MPKHTAEERERLTARAVDMKVQRYTYTAIAEELGVGRDTAKKWIENEYAKRSEHRTVSDAREAAIATYEALLQQTFERLAALGINSTSLNASGYINAARSLQERIDKLTGAEAPIKYQEVEDEIVIEWEDLDSPELEAEAEAEA